MARPQPRRAVVLLPNGFTLANLFFGVFAIVAASRGDFSRAVSYIVFGGVADALDGRVARATNTGSRFGEELDSLVDAISFGLAPTMIIYFAVFNQAGWDWIFCFMFTMCAVIRLARFNVEQAGRKKTHFHGLPSPAAGGTLATYYWFSQTDLYTQTMIADLPWHQMLRFIMLGLSFLMISNVQYAAMPTIGYRSVRQVLGSLLVIGTIVGVIFLPKSFFFPAAMAYVLYGLVATVFIGLLDRLPGNGDDYEEYAADGDMNDRALVVADDEARDEARDDGRGDGRRRRRRRRPRGPRPSGPPNASGGGTAPGTTQHAPPTPPTSED
ncbi:MAG: CDP-diacylglycerol--serine O-phosphatidyltransferase [Gemmatimonadaceae bacterium]|nr:CDP-diacylglycerol--serine O-phosphatidyltransferase [Gemmatimonadaceae bacterium]